MKNTKNSKSTISLGQIGDNEIKLLKIFKAVVDCGGFSAAETVLNISRPAISAYIAKLEKRINLILCSRGRAGFQLTEEGAIVYKQTKRLLELIDNFRNEIYNINTYPTGKLKIALSDTLSLDPRCQIPKIITTFSKNAPDVELCMEVEHMSDIEQQVWNEKVDIGFIPYHHEIEGLNYIYLFTDHHYLYCGENSPLYNLPEAEINDEIINGFRLAHAGVKPHEEIYNQISNMNLGGSAYFYEARIAMALSGNYICFLPEQVAKPYVDSKELKAIATNNRYFSLGVAVVSKKSHNNKAKELFFEAIQETLANTLEKAPY